MWLLYCPRWNRWNRKRCTPPCEYGFWKFLSSTYYLGHIMILFPFYCILVHNDIITVKQIKSFSSYPLLFSSWANSLVIHSTLIRSFSIDIFYNVVSFAEFSGKDLVKLVESALSKNIPAFQAKGSSLICFFPCFLIVKEVLLSRLTYNIFWRWRSSRKVPELFIRQISRTTRGILILRKWNPFVFVSHVFVFRSPK